MLISKLPGGIMKRWNREVLNIRRCQVREPTLNDMTDFTEEEAILMNDPLFSEAPADYQTKLEHPVRQKQMKNYTIKSEDENKKDVRGSSKDNSSKCTMCNGWHGPDECKVFNDMTVEERKASSCLSRNYAMVVMKSSHQNTQQRTVQDKETVRFVWQSIQLAYMDTRLEGRMTVKIMMVQERLSKTTVPTSKMFSVNQLELEKFVACV